MVDHRRNLRVANGIAIAWVMAASLGCDSSSPSVPVPVDAPEPQAITERQVAGRGGYYASADETVFLSLESADGTDDTAGADTGGQGWDVVPFELPAPQTINLCMDSGTDENDSVEIDQGGQVVASNSGQCNSVDLAAGSYQLKVTRDPASTGKRPMPMFVSGRPYDSQCPTDIDPFADPNNLWFVTSIGGWIQGKGGDPSTNRVPFSRTLFAGGTGGSAVGTGSFAPLQGVKFSKVKVALKNLDYAVKMTNSDGATATVGGDGYLAFVPNSQTTLQVFAPMKGLDWSFNPSALIYATGVQYPWIPVESYEGKAYVGTYIQVGGPPSSPIQLNLAMRAYPTPAGADNSPLGIGEVAITPAGSRYTYVLNDGNAFPSDFSRVMTAASSYTIRTGCDASVNLYPGTGFSGSPIFVGRNTVVQKGSILSAKVVRTKQILVQANACTGCNLSGVNLSGYTLRGVNLTDVDMSGANLTDAVMDQASLTRVNLDRAILTRTTFRQATFSDVGFTGTDLRNTTLDPKPNFRATVSDPCSGLAGSSGQSRFANTDVGLIQLPTSIWPLLDLSGVRFDRSGVSPAILANASVCGSRLRNVSLTGLDLTGTQFDGSDLTGASFAGDTGAKGTSGVGPTFRRATLDATNFSNVSLLSSVFDNATGRGTRFTNAFLNGGSMQGATMPGIAATFATFSALNMSSTSFDDASGTSTAVFDGARFSGDTMEFVNLTSASMNNTVFSGGSLKNATLTQTQFVNATFSSIYFDNVRAGSANFTTALFSGVDMTNASYVRSGAAGIATSFSSAVMCGLTLSNTDFSGANLSGAIVPLEPLEIKVPPKQTWICLQGSLAGLLTSASTTCPDGAQPLAPSTSCGGDDWVATTGLPLQCCIPGQEDCARLRAGEPCGAPCDCRSKVCGNDGKCL